eukprot:gb/GECG01009136.1/.p1 GENE.gb/GECG01009136.1/~~gb/GECG01009136.1/.p1  ORF type:complete len:791 (+),score=82.58 gb/GECG01009136.1/:1-2373(+)
MGVHGLTGWMRSCPQVFSEQHELEPGSRLVVDAKGLGYFLYTTETDPDNPPLDYLHGGEYAALYQRVVAFVERLRRSGIVPFFVVDGLPDPKKSATSQSRTEDCQADLRELERILSLLQEHPSGNGQSATTRVLREFGPHKFVKPQLLLATVLTALVDSNVYVYRTRGEADIVIASLTSESKWKEATNALCGNGSTVGEDTLSTSPIYVLSNDSDFVIFDIPGVIPFADLQSYTENESNTIRMVARVFKARKLAEVTRIPVNFLPTFACLVGNDFTPTKGWLHRQMSQYAEHCLQNDAIPRKKKKRRMRRNNSHGASSSASSSADNFNPHYVIEVTAQILREIVTRIQKQSTSNRSSGIGSPEMIAADVELMTVLFGSNSKGRTASTQESILNCVLKPDALCHPSSKKKRKKGKGDTRGSDDAFVEKVNMLNNILGGKEYHHIVAAVRFVCFQEYSGTELGIGKLCSNSRGRLVDLSESAFKKLCLLFCELEEAREMYDIGKVEQISPSAAGNEETDRLFYSGQLSAETYSQTRNGSAIIPLSILSRNGTNVEYLCNVLVTLRSMMNRNLAASDEPVMNTFQIGTYVHNFHSSKTAEVLANRLWNVLASYRWIRADTVGDFPVDISSEMLLDGDSPERLMPPLLSFSLAYAVRRQTAQLYPRISEESMVAQLCTIVERRKQGKAAPLDEPVDHLASLLLSSSLVQSAAIALLSLFGNKQLWELCLPRYYSGLDASYNFRNLPRTDYSERRLTNESYLEQVGNALLMDEQEKATLQLTRRMCSYLLSEETV